jgi:hypothetical protein
MRSEAVSHALWADHTLVKTWAMRGTLHLLPAAEYPMWVSAQRTRSHYLAAAWLRSFGVSREELERLLDAVSRALDGPPPTGAELVDEVGRLTGSEALGEKVRDATRPAGPDAGAGSSSRDRARLNTRLAGPA